jgi:hypothetical protein
LRSPCLVATAAAKERPDGPAGVPVAGRIGTVSGAAVVRLCADVGPGGAAVDTPVTARCVGYFQGVVDALESLKVAGRIPYCLPDDFTA